MKKLVLAFLMVVLLANMASAGGDLESATMPIPVTIPADMKMVTSTKALESYAKEQVASASVSAGSSGVIMPGGTQGTQVFGQSADIREILGLLAKEKLSFRVLEPKGDQYLYVSLYDSYGFELFFGSNQYRLLSDGRGGWLVPKGAGNVVVKMCDYVPIVIPGVEVAYAVTTNDWGQRNWTYFNIWNGHVMFPSSMAGMTGQLIVEAGGNSAAYDMATGNPTETTPISLSPQVSLKGLVTLDDPDTIISNPVSVDGQGENPLYQIKSTVNRTVTLYGETSEGELATGVYVREVGKADLMYFDISVGALPLSPGVYDLWFVYPNFGNDAPSLPPYYGDGKG